MHSICYSFLCVTYMLVCAWLKTQDLKPDHWLNSVYLGEMNMMKRQMYIFRLSFIINNLALIVYDFSKQMIKKTLFLGLTAIARYYYCKKMESQKHSSSNYLQISNRKFTIGFCEMQRPAWKMTIVV